MLPMYTSGQPRRVYSDINTRLRTIFVITLVITHNNTGTRALRALLALSYRGLLAPSASLRYAFTPSSTASYSSCNWG